MTLSTKERSGERGFVALISSVIISVILMSLALTVGTNGAFARLDALNAEYKRVSLALAESCANAALLKIAQNYDYTPGAGDTVSLGNDAQGRAQNCAITSVSYPNGKNGVQNTAVITTRAQYPSPNGAWSSITVSSTVQNPAFAVPARASVVVQTHVNNDDGGTKQAGDFTMTLTATNPSPSTFPGAETGQIAYIDPGSYSVAGSTDSEYSKNTSAGCSGSLLAGEVGNCVITYDDVAVVAALTVTAEVINNNGGTMLPSDFNLYIDGIPSLSGVPRTGLAPGSHVASADPTPAGYSASVWGDDCAVPGDGTIMLSAGQNKTCTIVYDDAPPPSPICVDTVLMLDRTGSMSGPDLTDERNAANNLLGLYGALTPLPKSAVGVFGAVGAGEPFNAAITQTLTTVYSLLTASVTTNLATSNGYTNLASAINVSQAEFDANGTPGKGHVLILLSDGGTNRPNAPSLGDTGWKKVSTAHAPSSWDQNAVANIQASDDIYIFDDDGQTQGYSTFSFPAIPGGASITGIEVRGEARSTDSSGCQLRAALSWNDGASYTSSQSVSLNNTDAPFTLGGVTNTWGRSWAAGDISDAHFVLRVEDYDPGGFCTNSATTYVDYLEARVHYSTPADPDELALQAADAAKLAGTQIFTIHFGEKGSGNQDINFLATLASGTTPNGSHQPGSANDQSGSPSSGNIGLQQPTATHAPQNWSNPGNAFTSNNQYATSSTEAQEQGYSNFGLSLPPGATVSGIEAQIEGKSTDSNGCEIETMLSWNGGASWTSVDDGNNDLSGGDSTITFGGSTSLWGRSSWSASELSDANFVLKFRFDDQSSGSCTNGTTVSVDQVRVNVYYTGAVPENTDGDNFYVSPNSSDMQSIFQAIGEKVCPALVAPPPAPTPTHGTLLVITHVVNDNGGLAQSSDFPMTVSGLNPVPNVFPMAGVAAPGSAIQLDPGGYSVTQDTSGLLYDVTTSPACSGTIAEGEVLTCTITNDDLPPPVGSTGTPVPPSSIIIGSWQETP